jgi:predicted nucleotidyltransferase
MTHKSRKSSDTPPLSRRYRGADVPMAVIRRYARQVAERFRPDKIILFGSHAYGTPHEDSDVDLLVIMPARNQLDQAFRIRLAIPAPFPMDLLVRTPHNLKWRLQEGESFSSEIVAKGKVLYEKDNAGMDPQSRKRLPARRKNRPRKRAVP